MRSIRCSIFKRLWAWRDWWRMPGNDSRMRDFRDTLHLTRVQHDSNASSSDRFCSNCE